MTPGKASATAVSTAAARAAHLHVHEGEPIFRDTFALPLSGVASLDKLREMQARWAPADAARCCAFFALRHRYAEDRLERALARGVEQVVLLGAGLDSLALRRPSLAREVALFEVDHPESQRWKLGRIAELGLATPDVRFVPVDFQTERVEARLVECGLAGSELVLDAIVRSDLLDPGERVFNEVASQRSAERGRAVALVLRSVV